MKFICFGYLDVENWGKKSQAEQLAMIDACCAYDETLQKNGNWVAGEGLQGPEVTATLRFKNGKVSITDGPYAETKEILGGLLVIEAKDRDHALQLIANHPGVQMGTWEVRPAEDLTGMIAESQRRRSAGK